MTLTSPKYCQTFNHAYGFENIFNEERNYRFFSEKYQFYISPIADTLPYCQMSNHFHFLIKIKNEEEFGGWLGLTSQKLSNTRIQQTFDKYGADKRKWKAFEKFEAEQIIMKQSSKRFFCYTQSFNKVFNRGGYQFVPNYKQKEITSKNYRKQVHVYTHNDAVKQRFVRKPNEWNFSTYNPYIFEEENFVIKNHILDYFDSVESLKASHLDNPPLPNDFI
ncbi:MAG: hypothetical protein ACUVQP_10225 [Bacteroidales bacterium]